MQVNATAAHTDGSTPFVQEQDSLIDIRARHQHCLRLLHTQAHVDQERQRSERREFESQLEQARLRFQLEEQSARELHAKDKLELTQEVERCRARTADAEEAMTLMKLEHQSLQSELQEALQRADKWCREAEELSEVSGSHLAQQDALHAELEQKEKVIANLQDQLLASTSLSAELRSECVLEKEAATEAKAMQLHAQEKADAWHAEQVRHAELLHRLWLQHLDVQDEKARSESKLRFHEEDLIARRESLSASARPTEGPVEDTRSSLRTKPRHSTVLDMSGGTRCTRTVLRN
mmetsp:Transcript_5427/g.12010  ORF Transcript_5427/g.12010 Transcript_5427/m.12010 type:complete len:293 (-) Transcript_5427:190-1068(-)